MFVLFYFLIFILGTHHSYNTSYKYKILFIWILVRVFVSDSCKWSQIKMPYHISHSDLAADAGKYRNCHVNCHLYSQSICISHWFVDLFYALEITNLVSFHLVFCFYLSRCIFYGWFVVVSSSFFHFIIIREIDFNECVDLFRYSTWTSMYLLCEPQYAIFITEGISHGAVRRRNKFRWENKTKMKFASKLRDIHCRFHLFLWAYFNWNDGNTNLVRLMFMEYLLISL